MKEEEEEEEANGSGSGSGLGSSSLSYHSTTSPSIAPRSMSSSFDEPLDELFDSPMDEDDVVRRCSLGSRNKQPYCASSTAMLNGSSVVANPSTSNRRRIKVGILYPAHRHATKQQQQNNPLILEPFALHLIHNQLRQTSLDLTFLTVSDADECCMMAENELGTQNPYGLP